MTAKPRAADRPADVKPAEAKPAAEEKPATKPGDCVVDEPFHVGRAVNGKVCSYHANRFRADGTPR